MYGEQLNDYITALVPWGRTRFDQSQSFNVRSEPVCSLTTLSLYPSSRFDHYRINLGLDDSTVQRGCSSGRRGTWNNVFATAVEEFRLLRILSGTESAFTDVNSGNAIHWSLGHMGGLPASGGRRHATGVRSERYLQQLSFASAA